MYADVMALFSFGVNYLLLAGSCQILEEQEQQWRLLLAAGVGGLYTGICFVSGFHFLMKVPWRIVSIILICLIAFEWDKRFISNSAVFVLMNMAVTGTAVAFHKSSQVVGTFISLTVTIVLTTAINAVEKRNHILVPVEIRRGDRRVQLTALYDTGNNLKDPITGEGVMIIGVREAEILTGLSNQEIGEPLETINKRPLLGLRLIPYRSIGNNRGLLLAMKFQDVVVNGKRNPTVVAFSSDVIGGTQFQALTGGVLR